jgi:hypothetical protein
MKKTILTCAITASLLACASANTFTFQTAPGATEAGGNPVDATVTFLTSANTLNITLTDLLANPKTVAQLLSDLTFAVTIGNPATASLTSSSGVERTVASNGSYTDGPAVAAGWVLSNPSAGLLHLDDLAGTGHAGPAHTIIGGPDLSNTYSAANNSIAGNGPHNPFLANSATFVLNVPGMTVDSTISRVVFSFGTASGNDVPGQMPDGGTTAILLGVALTGFSLIRRKLS